MTVGCRPSGPSYRSGGAPRRRVVALTFDDGPAAITPRFLRVLENENVPATFFLVGRQIAGHEALLNRMLRDGFALGDHTMTHANVAGGGPSTAREVEGPIGIIRRASGYRPCLFRAPYGAVSRRLIARARALGMASIEWNVDPRDWSRPSTGTIEHRILSETRPGSIIIMHDGGGPEGKHSRRSHTSFAPYEGGATTSTPSHTSSATASAPYCDETRSHKSGSLAEAVR